MVAGNNIGHGGMRSACSWCWVGGLRAVLLTRELDRRSPWKGGGELIQWWRTRPMEDFSSGLRDGSSGAEN